MHNVSLTETQSRNDIWLWLGLAVHLEGPSLLEGSMHVKQTVRDLLDQLPDDCTLEDVLYHLYVIEKVQKGMAELDAGRGIPHEQVAEEMRRKWQVGDVG